MHKLPLPYKPVQIKANTIKHCSTYSMSGRRSISWPYYLRFGFLYILCVTEIEMNNFWKVHGHALCSKNLRFAKIVSDSSFMKWPSSKSQFRGHIWPLSQWKHVMNIQSHQTFVKRPLSQWKHVSLRSLCLMLVSEICVSFCWKSHFNLV